jgi:hypothetical protein
LKEGCWGIFQRFYPGFCLETLKKTGKDISSVWW